MREIEIKFRAWHREEKRWLDISYLFLDSEDKVIGYKTPTVDTMSIGNIELTQYTGQKVKGEQK